MSCYMGTRTWRCRDCGDTEQIPWDYCRPGRRQPKRLRQPWNRMVDAHARRMPLLHPALLPAHHAPRTRR